MTLKKVIRTATSLRVRHLRTYRKTGFARCAVWGKTISHP